MTRKTILVLALACFACGGKRPRSRGASDMPFSQTKVDSWQVEVVSPPEGSKIVVHMSVSGHGEMLEKIPMEEVEGQPNVFRGSLIYGANILITIDVVKNGVGFCGDEEIAYCGPIRLWKDETSAGNFVEKTVRFNSWKSNPAKDDSIVCKDGSKEGLGHWQDYRCVYSNYVFE